MAQYNEILVGRYNRFLQKLLQMKGGPPAAQLAGDIATILPLFNGAENRYLEEWYRYGKAINLAATVANTGHWRMRNPATSNVIAVLEKLQIAAEAGNVFIVSQGPIGADLATVSSGKSLDSRNQGFPIVVSSSELTSTTGFTAEIEQAVLAGNTTLDMVNHVDQELLLLPGEAIDVHSTVANSAFRISAMWRERFLEESERA